jgi:hypothetical protein
MHAGKPECIYMRKAAKFCEGNQKKFHLSNIITRWEQSVCQMRIPPDDKNTVQYAGTQDDNIMITFQQRVEASSDSSMIHQMIASISR